MNAAAKAIGRWVSLTEAVDAIRGRRDEVKAWLLARGLVRRAPWGAVGVDLEEAMRQLAREAEVVRDQNGPGVAFLIPPATSAPEPPSVQRPATPRRPGRPAKASPSRPLRYEPIP